MTTGRTRGRPSQEQYRLLVGQALLILGDATRLAESPLVQFKQVRQRATHHDSFFAEGEALRECLVEAARVALERLTGNGPPAVIRSVLESVVAGHSVASTARSLRLSREHTSRTYWKTATDLVTRIFLKNEREAAIK